jgi:hypothetical protein
MVRRVEDKIAAGAPPAPPASPGRPAPPKTAPVRPGKKDKDDTAEFKLGEVREALKRRTDDTSPAARPLQPLSDVLLADGARGHVREDTDPLHRTDATLPPGIVRFPEIITFPRRDIATDQTSPALARPEVFRFLENNLMEIDFSGKIFIKQGTIYSYCGNLTFWVKERRPGGVPALVIITGTGRLSLTDKDREITFMNVAEELVHVGPLHLLACEETLAPRYTALGAGGLEFLVLEGRGMAALSVASKPLPLVVTPEMPISVPSASVISWSGSLIPRLVEDRQLYEVMLPPGSQRSPLIRLEGTGRVLLEQSAR